MRLTWLLQAHVEFHNIAEEIAVEHADAANRFERCVTAAVDHLRSFPDAGRKGRVQGTREVVILGFPYIVVYRVDDNCVQILTVRHAAREWPES